MDILKKYHDNGTNAINGFIDRIFRASGYKLKMKEMEPIEYWGVPTFVTNDREMGEFFDKTVKVPHIYFDGNSYSDVLNAVRKSQEEFRDPRVVLVGIDPLRNLRSEDNIIETYAPFWDIDEDGFLEIAGSCMPPDQQMIYEHIKKIKENDFSGYSGKEKTVIVVQEGEKRVIEKAERMGLNYAVLHEIDDRGYEEWKDADMIIQASDGRIRIHSDSENWDVVEKFLFLDIGMYRVLDGREFEEKAEEGYRFDRYPVVFSEACGCGKPRCVLTRAFLKAGSLYIASTTSTSNVMRKTAWDHAACGDGVKYGIMEKLDENPTMFGIFRNVINELIDHLGHGEKIDVREVLSGRPEVYRDVHEVTTFTLFGLDRPSPVPMREQPKKIGDIEGP